MKIEILKEYIRKTVKEEIKSVLKEELRYQLTEIFLSNNSDVKPKNGSSNSNSFIEKSEKKTQTISENGGVPPKKKIKYTNNPILNDVLNETTGRIPSEGGMAGLMGGGFDKIGGGDESLLMESESSQTPQAPPDASDAVKTVFGAMTRDYRSLMKAVDKKQGRI